MSDRTYRVTERAATGYTDRAEFRLYPRSTNMLVRAPDATTRAGCRVGPAHVRGRSLRDQLEAQQTRHSSTRRVGDRCVASIGCHVVHDDGVERGAADAARVGDRHVRAVGATFCDVLEVAHDTYPLLIGTGAPVS